MLDNGGHRLSKGIRAARRTNPDVQNQHSPMGTASVTEGLTAEIAEIHRVLLLLSTRPLQSLHHGWKAKLSQSSGNVVAPATKVELPRSATDPVAVSGNGVNE